VRQLFGLNLGDRGGEVNLPKETFELLYIEVETHNVGSYLYDKFLDLIWGFSGRGISKMKLLNCSS